METCLPSPVCQGLVVNLLEGGGYIYKHVLIPSGYLNSHGKSPINGGLMGKSSIDGSFSMAMFNNQRVIDG